MKKRFSSLKWQILFKVVVVHGIVALILTVFQLWLDYNKNLESIKKNLSSSYEMFGPSLSEAFYHVNTTLTQEIFKGILSQQDFLGLAVYDGLSDELIIRGNINTNLQELEKYLTKEFLYFNLEKDSNIIAYQHAMKIEVNKGVSKYFGNLIVFSNKELAFDRMKDTIVVVFFNSLIKAFVLVVMFLLIFNKLLIHPLTKINHLLSELSIKNLKSHRLTLDISKESELYTLQIRFNKLLDDLYLAQERERSIQHQSKYATVGEMITNIAHQWRQPLATMNLIIANLEAKRDKNTLDEKYLQDKLNEIEQLNLYMSQTIEDFLSFFNPDKTIEHWNLQNIVKGSVLIMKGKLEKENIDIKINIPDEYILKTQKQDLIQVLIILISNSIDSIVKKANTTNRTIEIGIEISNNTTLYVKDYGQGIDRKTKDKIFDPYFTQKDKGIGLGLYIAQMIVEKSLKASITASNHSDGAIFKISF